MKRDLSREKLWKTRTSNRILAEYDALPGLGHACGHNLIGTISVAAAIALSETLEEIGGEVVVSEHQLKKEDRTVAQNRVM